jgi:uncharacterized protein YijF (DUF1287 family)
MAGGERFRATARSERKAAAQQGKPPGTMVPRFQPAAESARQEVARTLRQDGALSKLEYCRSGLIPDTSGIKPDLRRQTANYTTTETAGA